MQEVVEILNQAHEAVEKSQLPDELRPVAFEKAVDIILALTSPPSDARRPTDRGVQDTDADRRDGNSAMDVVDKIAGALQIEVGVVERVFGEHGGGQPRIILPSPKLSPSKSAATREIALLVVAARTAVGLDPDDYTPVREIRKVAEDFNKCDPANFASTIREMNQYFRVRGDNQSREVKLNQPGREAAIQMISKLGGGSV